MRHFNPETDSMMSIAREIQECKNAIKRHRGSIRMEKAIEDATAHLAELMRIESEMEVAANSGQQIRIT